MMWAAATARTMSNQLQLFESSPQKDAWSVRISRRARRLSVRVYPGGRVEVVVPPGASANAVHRFVHSHREWIDQRVADLSCAAPAQAQRPDTIKLKALNKSFRVDYRPTAERSVTLHKIRGEDRLVLVGAVDSQQTVWEALRRWLMELARVELGPQLAAAARLGGFAFKRVQIRRQRTRWGSCSATGTISLNVCLLFQEPAVVNYLYIHELCHTKHMNHSHRFWSLVEQHEPQYKRLDRELSRGWQNVPGWVFG
jgi:predicted metal-dependent hydrolase